MNREPMTEAQIATLGRCNWQTAYGVVRKPRGREIPGHGHTLYCGRKATHGHYCREHAADAKAERGAK